MQHRQWAIGPSGDEELVVRAGEQLEIACPLLLAQPFTTDSSAELSGIGREKKQRGELTKVQWTLDGRPVKVPSKGIEVLVSEFRKTFFIQFTPNKNSFHKITFFYPING